MDKLETQRPARTVDIVTAEIQTLHRQAQQMALGYAIEIGRRLAEVKAMLPHGAWGEYLRDKLGYKPSTANNFMRIFDAYGAEQQSLFGGEAKSQALGDLSYTKALALLVLPEEEREEYLAGHDVEGMSTRELQKALRELQEARAEQHSAEAARQKAEEDMRLANERLSGMGEEVEQARKAQEEAEHRAEGWRLRLERERERQGQAAAAAEEETKALRAELEELRARPVEIAVEKTVDEEALRAAAETARKEAEAALEKRIQKAERAREKAQEEARAASEALSAAQRARTEAEERSAAAEKELQVAGNGAVAAFQVYFRQAQEMAETMWALLREIEEKDRETAGKLRGAMQALAGQIGEEQG